LNFRNTDLLTAGALLLLKNINPNIVNHLDLSENKLIKAPFYQELGKFSFMSNLEVI
jgi:hypothetical protein